MKLAMAQMSMDGNPDHNLRKTIKYIGDAAQVEADLIFFPELQFSPF